MGIKKSIGWTDKTINPIKGMCKGGCWYCWTKPLYKRKFLTPEIRLECRVFYDLPYSNPKKIFLCSTHDLFGSWIPKKWRDMIFECIESYPQHIFQILTKMPQNIDRPMPDNVWLGVSIARWKNEDLQRLSDLREMKAKIKFISIEPILDDFSEINLQKIDWIIIGRMTGYGHKYDPQKYWIEDLVEGAILNNIPIFMKDNLKEIYGAPLIQESPE